MIGGCVGLMHKDELPEIPPRHELPISCYVSVSKTGPFTLSTELYLDDGALRTLTITAQGIGVDPPPANPKPEQPEEKPAP